MNFWDNLAKFQASLNVILQIPIYECHLNHEAQSNIHQNRIRVTLCQSLAEYAFWPNSAYYFLNKIGQNMFAIYTETDRIYLCLFSEIDISYSRHTNTFKSIKIVNVYDFNYLFIYVVRETKYTLCILEQINLHI